MQQIKGIIVVSWFTSPLTNFCEEIITNIIFNKLNVFCYWEQPPRSFYVCWMRSRTCHLWCQSEKKVLWFLEGPQSSVKEKTAQTFPHQKFLIQKENFTMLLPILHFHYFHSLKRWIFSVHRLDVTFMNEEGGFCTAYIFYLKKHTKPHERVYFLKSTLTNLKLYTVECHQKRLKLDSHSAVPNQALILVSICT